MLGEFRRISLLAVILLPLLADCGDRTPIEIGFIGPLSGHSTDLGLNGLNGVRLAIEQQNHKGGIDGRPILLITEDDRQTPDVAIPAFERLAARPVQAIIGPMTSAIGMALQPLANQRHLLLLSPTITTDALTGADDDFIRVIADTRRYATMAAQFFRQERNLKSIALIYDSDNLAYANSWRDDFRREFAEHDGDILTTTSFRSSASAEFASVAENALKSGAEAVVVIGNAVDAALICQQIRLIDAKIPIITSEWAATENFVSLGGQAVEGVFVAQFIDNDSQKPEYLAFRKLYIERFQQDPGYAGVAGFDAATVLIAALRGRKSSESIKEAILRIADFDGLQGPLHIDRFGDSARPTYISVIRNGKIIRAN
jgi:branched-chain amino acid transport system substrate-binding protein